MTPIGTDVYGAGGGGITVMGDGRGLAILRGNANAAFGTAIWSGSWGMLSAVTTPENFVSAPIVTSSGAFAAHQEAVGAATSVDTFDAATSTWTIGTTPALPNNNQTNPVVAISGAGNPLVLGCSGSPAKYIWSLRAGGTWSAPAPVPGIAPPTGFQPVPALAATTRVGSGDVLGVFATPGGAFSSATFSAGAWSTPVPVASDLTTNPENRSPMVVTALPDGRVALVYETPSNLLMVGFWDGSTWSGLKAIPMAIAADYYQPFSVAPGASGAVLEVAFINASSHIAHTRLVDEATWTWSAPLTVDATTLYTFVSIAVGP